MSPTSKAVRAVAYYRVSTARQGRSGLGLDAQRETVERFAASRGWTLIDAFTEMESGKVAARSELEHAPLTTHGCDARRHWARPAVGRDKRRCIDRLRSSALSNQQGGEPLTQIRTATPEDAEAIAGVHVSGWQWAYAGLLPESLLRARSVPDRASFWHRYTSDPVNWPVFLVEGNSGVVGFASVVAARDNDLDRSKVSELAAIYLLREATGKGLGSLLLRRCREEARGRGYISMVLWVLEGNDRALRFYEHRGFVADETSEYEEQLGANEIRLHADIPEGS